MVVMAEPSGPSMTISKLSRSEAPVGNQYLYAVSKHASGFLGPLGVDPLFLVYIVSC